MNSYWNATIAAFLVVKMLFEVSWLCAAPIKPTTNQRFTSNVLSISSGVGQTLRREKPDTPDFLFYPTMMRFGFNINRLAGVEGKHSAMLLTIEPFVTALKSSEHGIETGCSVGMNYVHHLSGLADIYVEGSVAPMVLTIHTTEQGAGGFNFLDQVGAGAQYALSSRMALFTGYRFRHISHAELLERSNGGINSHSVVAGISFFY